MINENLNVQTISRDLNSTTVLKRLIYFNYDKWKFKFANDSPRSQLYNSLKTFNLFQLIFFKLKSNWAVPFWSKQYNLSWPSILASRSICKMYSVYEHKIFAITAAVVLIRS